MSKLEKFKRRLIRSVAMLLIQEKKPEDEMWEILKEEIGKNCKVLWERMRALTVKKLKRLLAAEDKIDLIPKFAQMSDTDWLFFDLIIAHEEEDVIGKNDLNDDTSNSKVLTDLFTLVQKFNIEEVEAEKLAEAWTAATIFYNSTGHRCSPMLMQRRWYQLKKCTRQRFYDFWFSYRGVLRHLKEAQSSQPNELQQAIATKYPHIVTAPFQTWEELINHQLVILPEEFEKYKSKTYLPKPCDENSPDLLLLEPVIETIDLEGYISDDEKKEDEISNGVPNVQEPITSCIVKIEPEDIMPNDNEFEDKPSSKSQISMEVMSSLVQEETLLDMNGDMTTIESEEISQENATNADKNEVPESDIINEAKSITQTVINKPTQDISIAMRNTLSEMASVTPTNSLQENISETISDSFEEGIPKITNVFGNVDITNEDIMNSLTRHNNTIEEKPESNVMPVSVNEKDCDTINLDDSSDTDDVILNEESFAPSKDNAEETSITNSTPSPIQDLSLSKIRDDNDDNEEIVQIKQPMFGGLRNYFDFKEEGIELVDDGIEYVEDDELEEKIDCHTPNKIENEDNEDLSESDEGKFDLKLLMQTVVYTTKLDDMKVLKDKYFNSINNQSLIDSITIESKPVSSKSLYIPNSVDTDNSMDDDDNDEIDDVERVQLSSNLLKKPKYRAYNPIKLCKNPDFNTKLKRLTVGFLSSSRNRFLLKLCKPMTIDMSKAFESKLINGTMYLNNSITTIETKNDGNDNKAASVIPSAISVQSLIDNMVLQTVVHDGKNNEQRRLVCSFDGSLAEKNKIINLPDVHKVPAMNQQFLTEDVTPFAVQKCNLNQPGKTINQNYDVTNEVPVVKQVSNFDSVELDRKPIILDSPAQLLKETPVENTVEVLANTANIVINDKRIDEVSDSCNPNDNNQFYTNNSNSIPSGNSTQVDTINKKSKKKKLSLTSKQISWRCNTNTTKISWVKDIKYTREDDALITIDTLHKMLSHIKNVYDATAPVKNKTEKKKGKKMKKYEKLQNKSNETVNNKTLVNKNEIVIKETEPITNHIKTPIVTVVYANQENDYKRSACCWARTRINLKKKRSRYFCKHTCKRYQCTCCCKIELRNLLSNIRALKSACDSIESVVQQTRELIAVQTTDTIEPITEAVVMETHVDLSEDPSDNEMSDIPNHVSSTVSSDSNKILSDCNIQKSDENINIQEIHNSNSMEIAEVKSATVAEAESQLIPQFTPLANSMSADHNIETQPVQTIQISADATEPDCNDTSKYWKQKISICAKTYSKRYINSSNQQHNNQNKDIINTDNIEIKQNSNDKNSKEKILILNRRHLSKSTAENPIYLGKNKILVTNVKIPSPMIDNTQTPNLLEGVHTEMAIPKGVQLTLSPSGELICNLMPGAEIDTNSLSQLPSIMASLQTHLNLTGGILQPHNANPIINILGTNSEKVLDFCENESELIHERTMENYKFDKSGSVEGDVTTHNKTNIEHDTSSPKTVEVVQSCEEQASKIPINNKQTILDQNNEKKEINLISESTIVSGENIQHLTKDEHKPNESSKTKQDTVENIKNADESSTKTIDGIDALSTNRKTLLSDLMEMSGISAEDVAPTDNIQQLVEIPPLIPLVSRPTFLASGPNVPISDNYSSIQNKVLPVISVPIVDHNGKNQTLNLPQLNTITSYTELKYACNNNGSFFKLDYKTGTIVPISVCIKKTARSSDINSESVIDLTEDKDDLLEEQEDETQPNNNPKKRLILKAVKVKPLKVFRSVHRPTLLRKERSGLSKINVLKQNTNSILKPNITMVNSDNSIEKICVINSSDDEPAQRKRVYSSDSSDDEPLISIVKRRKMNTDTTSNEKEIGVREMNEQADKIGEHSKEAIPAEVKLVTEFPENEEINEDTEMATTLSIILDHTDAEEDCILGV